MAIKKRSKKKALKKRKASKKTVRSFLKKPKQMVRATRSKISVVIGQLILFAIIFIFSLILYSVSTQEMYVNLFLILSMLFGFVLLALLIVLLILLFLKVMKK